MTKLAKAKPRGDTASLAQTQPLLPRGLAEKIIWRPIGELKPFPGNPRRHPESPNHLPEEEHPALLDDPDFDRRNRDHSCWSWPAASGNAREHE